MLPSAIFSDLDGTFWSTELTLHPATIRAVDAIDRAGVPLVIATGRRALGALAGLRPLGLQDRPAIVMNGAIIKERLDGPSLSVKPIPTEDALATLREFRTVGLEPIVYVDDAEHDMVNTPGAAAGEGFLASAVGARSVSSLDEEIESCTVIGFGAFGFPRAQLETLASAINSNRSASAVINLSHMEGDFGIMVQGREVNKGRALLEYCAHHRLDPAQAVAVGDGLNDLEMLEAVGTAVVPANGAREALAVADLVVEPNEVGGWEQIATSLGL